MPEIEEICRRREAALAMGGPQKVARQRAAGKLTVRERIDLLADPGSFGGDRRPDRVRRATTPKAASPRSCQPTSWRAPRASTGAPC